MKSYINKSADSSGLPVPGSSLGRIFALILGGYVTFLLILNTVTILQNGVYIHLALVLPVTILCFFLAKRVRFSSWAFALAIFLASFAVKGIMVYFTHTQPVSDFKGFYDFAVKLANGDKSWSKLYYFSVWAYQTGPVAYYAVLMKIFGTGLLPLKLCNCFFMAGTNALIYLTGRKIAGEEGARCSAILYLLYPAPFFLAPVLTNQHFAAFMFFTAIYLLMRTDLNIFLRGAMAGIAAAVGNVVRPIGIVVIAALIVWAIIEVIRTRKTATAGLAAVMLVTYFVSLWGISSYFTSSGISPYGLANNFPLWKFTVGFNPETMGEFSYEDQNTLFYIADKEKRDEAAKRILKERLKGGPAKMIPFLVSKQDIMWACLDSMRWAFYEYDQEHKLVPPEGFEKVERNILGIEKIYYTLALLILMLGMFGVKKKDVNPTALFIILLLLAYFFVHLLIEVQVRYRYFAMIAVFILLSRGAQIIFDKMKLKAVK
jgi:hypothetical protein